MGLLPEGLDVRVTIVGETSEMRRLDSDGTYSLTFFNHLGAVARSGDTVEVRVLREDGNLATSTTVQLSSEQNYRSKCDD